jgi:hypothetical protein
MPTWTRLTPAGFTPFPGFAGGFAGAGGVVGAAVAGSATIADDPDADLGALIDQAIARLEPGLAL